MEHATAQRRLVRSRPELWAVVSSEIALGRHLAEFGEIRITRVEPETTVAWEGDRASGTVELAPAGWGTKVILTATTIAEPEETSQAIAAPAAEDAESEPTPEETSQAIAAPAHEPDAEPEPEPEETSQAIASPAHEPDAEPEPEPDEASQAIATAANAVAEPARLRRARAATDKPAAVRPAPVHKPARPRRGFFARLFRRRPKTPPPARASDPPAPKLAIPAPPAPTPDPSPPTPAPDPAPPGPDPTPAPPPPGPVPVPDPAPPVPDPAPAPPPGPVPVPDPEPPVPEPAPGPPPPSIAPPSDPPPAAAGTRLDPGKTVAILTEILDDLGSDHHRPRLS